MNDNLPELRDIHLPDGVSLWPPAHGWYIIFLALVLLYFLYKLYHFWRLKSKKIYALKLLSSLDSENIIKSASEISEILRRICVYRYSQAVALEGKEWLKFLQIKSTHKLSNSAAELLQNAPYANPQKTQYSEQNLQELISFTKAWIGENL